MAATPALAYLTAPDPAPPVLDAIIEREDLATLARAFVRLAAAEPVKAAVIARRYGLGGDPPQTLEEIAHDLGISRGDVRRIELRGVATLVNLARYGKF
jgi:DNA-directed RNA polymerase sigma subunit (sigma70/sigma32)